jgi:hypothetical protein
MNLADDCMVKSLEMRKERVLGLKNEPGNAAAEARMFLRG